MSLSGNYILKFVINTKILANAYNVSYKLFYMSRLLKGKKGSTSKFVIGKYESNGWAVATEFASIAHFQIVAYSNFQNSKLYPPSSFPTLCPACQHGTVGV